MIYGTYSSSTALFSKNEANEDAVVDNSDDEEMDDERDEFEDDQNLLSVFPPIHFLSITEDMFAGRAK